MDTESGKGHPDRRLPIGSRLHRTERSRSDSSHLPEGRALSISLVGAGVGIADGPGRLLHKRRMFGEFFAENFEGPFNELHLLLGPRHVIIP
jgi:hypothetical protein